jgi:hypothetical protein
VEAQRAKRRELLLVLCVARPENGRVGRYPTSEQSGVERFDVLDAARAARRTSYQGCAIRSAVLTKRRVIHAIYVKLVIQSQQC